MALVAFLRGVNVGGHRRFRPSIVARELSDYGVVNVGAAGTFVVRKPGPRAKFRAVLLGKLPFEANVVLCDGRDLIRLEMENPFVADPSRPDIVRFVSILSEADCGLTSIPCTLPRTGDWLVATYRVTKPVCLWRVPSPHEDDRLSGPDRQAVRGVGDNTELEHNNGHRADLKGQSKQGNPD